MARRSYGQYCTLAAALDVIGERWTLLMIRELMLGPRRFGDLLENLPGMGRNLLAERLRHLEREGIVTRTKLPPPAGSHVYELTDDGRELGPALAALGRWGVKRLAAPGPDTVFRPGWAMFPLSYMADTEAARGVRETYEFRVDGERFHLRVDDGHVRPRTGPAEDPDLVIRLEGKVLLDLLAGALGPVEAVSGGEVEIEGDPEALGHCLAIVAGERNPAQALSAGSPASASSSRRGDRGR